jgi:hypothetical protein
VFTFSHLPNSSVQCQFAKTSLSSQQTIQRDLDSDGLFTKSSVLLLSMTTQFPELPLANSKLVIKKRSRNTPLFFTLEIRTLFLLDYDNCVSNYILFYDLDSSESNHLLHNHSLKHSRSMYQNQIQDDQELVHHV